MLTLGHLALRSTWLRCDREALRVADDILDSGRTAGLVAALFRLRWARALADLGDRSGAFDALAAMRVVHAGGPRHADPQWVWWLDDVELTWHEGMIRASLGDHAGALTRFRVAYERERAAGEASMSVDVRRVPAGRRAPAACVAGCGGGPG